MDKDSILDEISRGIGSDSTINEDARARVLLRLSKLKEEKVHILITGATGSGKSSTINALFNSEKAKVGQGADPETMSITRYDFQNIVLFDTPGLGDGKEADRRHSKLIVDKLYEKDKEGRALVDLVLVILDGGSRDLGTSFQLINEVIIPNLGDDKGRLLVAINQADMAMKGRGWNHAENRPEPELVAFLDEKAASTKRRILESTGVSVDIVYYSAGYKDGKDVQMPYNLSKLMLFILRHMKSTKRALISQDINRNSEMWKRDDQLEDYRGGILNQFVESVKEVVSDVVGGIADTVSRAFSSVKSFFSSFF